MSAFNNYLEQLIRDLFKNGSPLPTQDTYLGIATQDPTDTGDTTGEPTGGWYSRQLIETTGAATTPAWTNATGKTGIENAQAITFPGATTTPGQISWVFLSDATAGATATNMLMRAKLSRPRTMVSGDAAQFGAGDVKFTFEVPLHGKYFLIAHEDPYLDRWDAGTKFDHTTLSSVSRDDLGEFVNRLCAADDGNKLYIGEFDNDIRQYSLGSPWTPGDGVTFVRENNSIDPDGGYISGGFQVSNDGRFMLAIVNSGSDSNDYLRGYRLTTPYDITTIDNKRGETQVSGSIKAGTATGAGDYYYYFDRNNYYIRRLNLSSPWSASNANLDQSYDADPDGVTNAWGMDVSYDGRYLWITRRSDEIYQYEMTTPYDVTTLNYQGQVILPGVSDVKGVAVGP